ncbi:MAG: type III effector [Alteromonadaceae bacterium]|jgi:hypothetical protein|uniref:HopJ type III effector protein n=1 Tax=Paraglaciecola agarilytica NO2 TaxID=1125747 RepID=A0ABQ0I3E2_9ALTE|nr:HopJ type III effector protein [Paraglaciecola agarilytica]MBN24950.1 type III effector [Alteromonadaceae bacterium]GAC03831.1 hypothetical protein GAGA_0968 [Paraglaciecola agarilytica NO2]|tara:strand:- start:25371 stop:25721 length:351 start_codon:yes stop_codon:yes gene_type:complete
MTIQDLITQVRTQPQSVEFSQVINTIQQHYQYTATGFSNGEIVNEKGSNEGSCKILYFAYLNQLTESETLHLFGAFYRDDVLQHPNASDHGNIRNFMQTGWQGVKFDSAALTPVSN